MTIPTPVVLFIFNRPQLTERVLRSIAAVRPSHLLVVADGPRAGREGESERCRQARAAIDDVDWPCRIETLYSETNLGCKHRIASGLDWVFSKVDEAIVLEDDCLPDPGFFRFCQELLERYRHDERIHIVRGTNFLRGRRVTPSSYYFSRFYNIWGWATWARAWKHYDVGMRQWPALRDSGWLERQLPESAMASLVRHFFDETHAGRLDTWDYQLLLAGWLRDAVAIVPAANLVTNIGHGEGATHTRNQGSHLAGIASEPLSFPLRHPEDVKVSAMADEIEWSAVYPRYRLRTSLWQRFRERLRAGISLGTR